MLVLLVITILISSCASPAPDLFVIEDYPCVTNTGTRYYVDASLGSDSNDGSISSPWKTVAKVNSFTFSPGDNILFKKGEQWRERIIPQSGYRTGWLFYGSYGAGSAPTFIGSVNRSQASDWTDTGGNIWTCNTPTSEDIGNIIFNNEASVGYKKFSAGALVSQGDFYYNPANGVLSLYSGGNPGSVYTDIECALAQHMVYIPHGTYPHIGAVSVSNIVFKGLAFKYGGAYAFKFQSVHHIFVLDNEISWMGGGEVDGQADVRYGNGVEFFDYAYYCKANGNRIWEIYDSGLSVQGIENATAAVGIEFKDNIIWNCAYASYELWYKYGSGGEESVLSKITFINNICSNAGGGWGSQRPGNGGFHVLMDRTLAQSSQIVISNNSFVNTGTVMLAVNQDFDNLSSVLMDYNSYSSPTNALLYYYFSTAGGSPVVVQQYQLSQSNSYQAFSGKDAHSRFSY